MKHESTGSSVITDRMVEEEVISTEEYMLLAEALNVAENNSHTSISSFLDFHDKTLVLFLRPRPRFSSELHQALCLHSLTITESIYMDLKFPLSVYDTVRSLCVDHGAVLSIPSPLVHCLASIPYRRACENQISQRAPRLWETLFRFQRQGVLEAVSRHGRVLLADDMGLGKTFQALLTAEYFRTKYVLVLCPATLRAPWQLAIKKWLAKPVMQLTSAKQLSIFSATSSRDPWDSSEEVAYVIASYDLLPRLVCNEQLSPSVVVADECHLLRNPHALRTKAAMPIFLRAKHRILVSGTPALSRPSELYPLLRILLETSEMPFLTYSDFLSRYCGGEVATNRAMCNAEELYGVLSSVMIRRRKADVTVLPPKKRRRVEIELSGDGLAELMKMRRQADDIVMQLDWPAPHQVRQTLKSQKDMIFTKLRMRTSDLKVPGVMLRIRQLLENKNAKILVFAHHLSILDAAESVARRLEVEYVRIDGCTNSNDRGMLVDKFQDVPSVRLAVLSLAVAGTGLTLTRADVVFFAELSWVPSLLAQAEDRAHRIGRTGEVMIEYASAEGTVDDLMWNALSSKVSILNRAVDGGRLEQRLAFDVSVMNEKPIFISSDDIQHFIAGTIIGDD